MGFIYLAAFEGCGMVIAQRLLRRYGRMVRMWTGLVLGLMLLMWLPSLYAFFLRFSMAAHWLALGTALLGAGAACLIPRRDAPRASDPHEPPLWLVLTVTVPLTILMAWMQYTHVILPTASGALMTGQATYGDLNLHLGIATGLVNAQYPPEYTILPGTLLGYPFLMDAMSGSLYMMGMALRWAFIIPGVLMSALTFWGFVMLAWEMTRDARAVLLASVLMFLNGGLGFIYVIDGMAGDPTRFYQVFTGYYKAPANLVDENIRWSNVLVDMMLPQRTLLAGWCTVLPALWLLLRGMKENDRFLFAVLGVWAGMLPMIHTHSFLALGIISAVVMGISVYQNLDGDYQKLLRNFLIYGVTTVALALPQLLTWTFPQTVGGGSLSIRPNWVNWNGHGLIDEYFWFWIKNVGLVYLVMIPAAKMARRREKMIAWGALGVYVIAELIQFQPNEYDNNKLFYVAFMVMVPLAAKYLVVLYRKLRGLPGRRLLAAVFVVVSTLSAVLSIGRECVSSYMMYSSDAMAAANYIMDVSEQDAVVLTGMQVNNPVSSIGGRKIVCGTPSFLYYHGVDYSAQSRAVKRMYEDPKGNQELFEQYGVDYIYISSSERKNYDIDFEALDELYPLVHDGGTCVYAVSERAQAASKGA